MGARGSGKTVLLNEIEDQAAARGWVVLAADSSTSGLSDQIEDIIAQANRDYEPLAESTSPISRSAERKVGLRLGPLSGSWGSTETFEVSPATRLRFRLGELASAAQRAGTSVLLTVDELHAADRQEARRLAGDLQHLTKREQMPLAFIGAGLSEMRATLMMDKKLTFFHRCEQYEMPPLGTLDATAGLRSTITAGDGAIEDDALHLAAESVAGSPYRMQVVGHAMWEIAGAPSKAIDIADARVAIQVAQETIDRNIGEPAWFDLSEQEQLVLLAVMDDGSPAALASAAQQMQMGAKQWSFIRHKLILSGYLAQTDDDGLASTGLVSKGVAAAHAGTYPTMSPAPHHSGKTLRRVCRKWMPRAKAHCILPHQHSGRCRSRH